MNNRTLVPVLLKSDVELLFFKYYFHTILYKILDLLNKMEIGVNL